MIGGELTGSPDRAKAPEVAFSLGSLTEPRLLVPRLSSGRPEAAIEELAQRLEAVGRIPKSTAFAEIVIRRELDLPTFVGEGVVVPHGRGAAVKALTLAVGLSDSGIPWGREGHLRAHCVFLSAIPPTGASRFLALLSALSGLIRDDAALSALKAAARPEDMLRVLSGVKLVRKVKRAPVAW